MGNEPDPLKEDFYWLMGQGGSAAIRPQYWYAQNTSNLEWEEAYFDTAKNYTWGTAVDYFNGTGLPVWVSIWGILTTDSYGF